MLKELFIRDFKLLRDVSMTFQGGLTAITGETGAGKTQCLEALRAVLGGRVGDDAISTGSAMSEITATFDMSGRPDVLDVLKADGWLDADENELILERRIERDGRSRGRLNGRRVPIGALQAVGDRLVDLLGQNARADLLTRPPLEILDSLGDGKHRRLVISVRDIYANWRESVLAYETEAAEIETARERKDLVEYQHAELENANLRDGEEKRLTREAELLESAKDRIEDALKATTLLTGDVDDDRCVRDVLQEVLGAVERLASTDETIRDDSLRLNETVLFIDELSNILRKYADGIVDDPEQRAVVENRLSIIHQLKRKYKTSESGLIELCNKLSSELERVSFASDRLKALASERDEIRAKYLKDAILLSKSRTKLAKQISREVINHLADLDLPNAIFNVVLESNPDDESTWRANGIDRAELLIATNPAQVPAPLKKVVSGGELSRLLIALKTVLAKRDRVPVLVFDEAEAGIGGETAYKVVEKLIELSESHQLILVSHLSQIASKADNHWVIEKTSTKNSTYAEARDVLGEDRVEEISRMLGARGDKAALDKLARSFLNDV